MSRRDHHARPAVEASKAPALLVETAPAAAPVEQPAAPSAPPAPEASPDAAALAAANERAESLAADNLALRVEVERLKAALASAESAALAAMGDEPAAEVRVPYVLSGVRYNGRDYEPGERFPFDPKRPPSGVSGELVEGVHYAYRTV